MNFKSNEVIILFEASISLISKFFEIFCNCWKNSSSLPLISKISFSLYCGVSIGFGVKIPSIFFFFRIKFFYLNFSIKKQNFKRTQFFLRFLN